MEIERKFLVKSDQYKKNIVGEYFRQGYISNETKGVIRVRIAFGKGFLTIKSRNVGITRAEFEYEIPKDDAEELLDTLCDHYIEKIRYHIPFNGFVWEVDEFKGENEGLVVAEIELLDENGFFDKPDWVGEEVSNDFRYYNSNLITNPYCKW